jgi:hypothetical protein
MAVNIFLDTSVLLAGVIDFGPQSAPAQSVMHAIAQHTVRGTAGLAVLPRVLLRRHPAPPRVPPDACRCRPSAGRRSLRAGRGL